MWVRSSPSSVERPDVVAQAMGTIRKRFVLIKYGSLVLCGLLLIGSSSFAATGKKTPSVKSKATTAVKSQQVVIKMSATRELLPDADHVGVAPGGSGGGVIVEMAPRPVTIIKDVAGDGSQPAAGSKGTHASSVKP